MVDDAWHHERFGDGEQHSYRILRELFRLRTPLQELAILELAEVGLSLVLDSKMQSSQGDEHVYHEALVHPGLLAHASPKSVLIAGGGEGATLREVLRHQSVERATMVEIDEAVVAACRSHLSAFHRGSFDDPRASVVFADARQYLETHEDKFDAIVVDISDPEEDSPSRMLFTREFYARCASRLTPGGVLIVQADIVGTADWHLFGPIVATLGSVFPCVIPYWAYVQSFHYPWGFAIASAADLSGLPYVGDEELARRLTGNLRYYDMTTHALGQLFTRQVLDHLKHRGHRVLSDTAALFPEEA